MKGEYNDDLQQGCYKSHLGDTWGRKYQQDAVCVSVFVERQLVAVFSPHHLPQTLKKKKKNPNCAPLLSRAHMHMDLRGPAGQRLMTENSWRRGHQTNTEKKKI